MGRDEQSPAACRAEASSPVPWRLVESGAGAGAWNMAVDEALLTGFDPQRDLPILRVYGWEPAAISLGRFQPAAEITPPPGADLVRRLSGGAAIHHQSDELTYAVVAPYAHFGRRHPRAAYEAIHEVIARALAQLGVSVHTRAGGEGAGVHGMCFAKATDYDLVATTSGASRKLVGSAQRRHGQVFLQHGSIPRSVDPLTPQATCLQALLDEVPTPGQVKTAFLEGFSHLASSFLRSPLSSQEAEVAEDLMSTRYAQPTWTHAL